MRYNIKVITICQKEISDNDQVAASRGEGGEEEGEEGSQAVREPTLQS